MTQVPLHRFSSSGPGVVVLGLARDVVGDGLGRGCYNSGGLVNQEKTDGWIGLFGQVTVVVVVVDVVVVDAVVVGDVVGAAVVLGGMVEPPSLRMTNSGGGSDSPKRDLVTQHFMAVLQRPSTLRTASQ